jgi:hypothetical protein
VNGTKGPVGARERGESDLVIIVVIAVAATGTAAVRAPRLWNHAGTVEAEGRGEEVGIGEADGATGIADGGDCDPIGEVGGGFDSVIETGVAAEGKDEGPITHGGRKKGGPTDEAQAGDGAGDGAGNIGDDDVVAADHGGLHVGASQRGSRCSGKIGAVEAPLKRERGSAASTDGEGGIRAG